MSISETDHLRNSVRENKIAHSTDSSESGLIRSLAKDANITIAQRQAIARRATELVERVRNNSDPVLMESFLTQYGLSTDEGVALMCLAEALLRVPDNETVDALIHDKIAPADWGKHLGQSSSSMVNASTWALLLTGGIIADEPEGIVGTLRTLIKRVGEPVIRTAVNQAIKELGNQFVLGETIFSAMQNSAAQIKEGYTFSYDMLGEAALTENDAKRYHLSYSQAISELGKYCSFDSVAENPGISVKLSALFSRYEFAQRERVMIELVARTRSLAMLAKSANMGFNIDAEESDRLDLSLDVIEAVLAEPSLADWDGFGIVVQAYSRRAAFVIDWLYDLAKRLDRNLMVRLVKGAYWDTEIKLAQVNGHTGFPVYTLKSNTDISYIACAKKLLSMTDRIYPQFATHNAHTVAAILELADNKTDHYEFQRLHGMGEALHKIVHTTNQTRCRIYAPVGAHQDLLAYLVRRLLENGANSSFVNQLVDESISAADIAQDPFDSLQGTAELSHPAIKPPLALFLPQRINSSGMDINDPVEINKLDELREPFDSCQWQATPMVPGAQPMAGTNAIEVLNPADTEDCVGHWHASRPSDIEKAFENAGNALAGWQALSPDARAEKLHRVADLYERNAPELISLTCREAGKTLPDSIAEIREAVDFLRYYAESSKDLMQHQNLCSRGCFVCISPWNFPLAIFTGQIAAALVVGNCVIAKPAEQTPLVAARAIKLFHDSNIDPAVLQLLPGTGSAVGAKLVSHRKLSGVCFTGSTATARLINQSMAEHCDPSAPLIAETGGLNAMIVDSTALPEQAITDIVESAFQSAGQRCSALRMLYVQSDIYQRMETMLTGAMKELQVGNPRLLKTDLGPLIDATANNSIKNYCDRRTKDNRLIYQTPLDKSLPGQGYYLPPVALKVSGIEEIESEVFGPVLHVASFESEDFFTVIDAINSTGYGLTFGLHTRVDERVQDVVDRLDAGNLYINRNQIGAVVGSQPFGGKNLSGTGPKAGGPHYLLRFVTHKCMKELSANESKNTPGAVVTPTVTDADLVQQSLDRLGAQHTIANSFPITQQLENISRELARESLFTSLTEIDNKLDTQLLNQLLQNLMQTVITHHHETIDLPGPTGESNRLTMSGSGIVLCLGQESDEYWITQVVCSLVLGNAVLAIAPQAIEKFKTLSLALGPFRSEQQEPGQLPLEIHDGIIDTNLLQSLQGFAAVTCSAEQADTQQLRGILAKRPGNIITLVTNPFDIAPLVVETSLCINTTAAGGNASLLAQTS